MKKLIVISVILMLSLFACQTVRTVNAADATLAPMQRQFFDNLGKVLNGGKLEFYEVGTSTPKATYANPGATVANSTTITLDSAGRANFYLDGCYKVIIKTSTGTLLDTIDKVCEYTTTVAAMSQWKASGVMPVYVSGTSFSCSGDQTAIFEPGLRIKSANSGGTVYSNVVSASYGGGTTTVTVVNESGALDSGISSVDVSIVTVASNGLPTKPVATKTGNYTVLATDCGKILSANLSAAATFTLPAANAVPSGCEIVTKNTTTWTLTISGTVDGVNNPTLADQYSEASLFSDGSTWRFRSHPSAATPAASKIPISGSDNTIAAGWIPATGHSALFVTEGTFVAPVAGDYIVIVLGGGGGGGGGGGSHEAGLTHGAQGGYGGSGGELAVFKVSLTASQNVTVTRGAGGNAGSFGSAAGGDGGSGSDGGSSSFGGSTAAGGKGGKGGVGTARINGSVFLAGLPGGNGGGNGGGQGGALITAQGTGSTGGNGANRGAGGGGGGGALDDAGGSTFTGGAGGIGADGMVLVLW